MQLGEIVSIKRPCAKCAHCRVLPLSQPDDEPLCNCVLGHWAEVRKVRNAGCTLRKCADFEDVGEEETGDLS